MAISSANSTAVANSQCLVSTLADDPDMVELLDSYVDDLQQRAQTLEKLASANDRAALASLSHQIKGSAGGYGFMPITDQAAIVEKQALAQSQAEDLQRSVDDLIALCRRARSRAA